MSLPFAHSNAFYLASLFNSEGSSPQFRRELSERSTKTTSQLKQNHLELQGHLAVLFQDGFFCVNSNNFTNFGSSLNLKPTKNKQKQNKMTDRNMIQYEFKVQNDGQKLDSI